MEDALQKHHISPDALQRHMDLITSLKIVAAHLHIDTLVTPYRYKINLFRFVLADIHLIASSQQLQINHIFQYMPQIRPLCPKQIIAQPHIAHKTDLMLKYQNYIQNGSFPYVVQLEKKRDIHAYLEGIYTSIILKDIMARYRIADAGGLDAAAS